MHYLTFVAVDVPPVVENIEENNKVKARIQELEQKEKVSISDEIELRFLRETQTTFAREVCDAVDEVFYKHCNEAEEYQEFEDMTKDLQKEYNEDTANFIKFPDGSFKQPYHHYDGHSFAIQDGVVFESVRRNGKYKSDLKRTKFAKKLKAVENYPYKKAYKTLERFVQEIHYMEYDEKNKGYGTYYNPYSLFDWYVIGGRWPNEFLVKEDCKEVYVGVPTKDYSMPAPEGYCWATAARMKDIEWKLMKELEIQERTKTYNEFKEWFTRGEVSQETAKGLPYKITEQGITLWDEMVYNKNETLEAMLERRGLTDDFKYPPVCYYYYQDEMLYECWTYTTPQEEGHPKHIREWGKEVDEYLDGLYPEQVLVCVDIHQ